MKNSYKRKRENSKHIIVKKDPEEAILFGPWNIPTKRKDISKIYERRRKLLLKGNCIRCGKELDKLNNLQCHGCGTNLQEFCFQTDLKERDHIIHDFVNQIKYKYY